MKIIAAIMAIMLAILPLGASAESARHSVEPEAIANISNFSSRLVGSDEPVTGEIFSHAKVTVINVWAGWCGHCIHTIPFVQQAHQYYSAQPNPEVQIIGVPYLSSSFTEQQAVHEIAERGLTYMNIIHDSVLLSVIAQNPYVPQFLIVDCNGNVVSHEAISFDSVNEIFDYIEPWLETLPDPVQPVEPLLGDIDGDGEVTGADALLILRYSMGLIDLDPEAIILADIDGDGSVNGADALLLLRISLGLIS